MADSDEQVAATVAAWERDQGLSPRDWPAIGAEERGETEEEGTDASSSEGFDEDEYNRQLIERRHRSINVTRSFELRGVFKRLARLRLLPPRHVFRPVVRSRAPRPVRRTRATARSPGDRESDPPHLAFAGGAR